MRRRKRCWCAAGHLAAPAVSTAVGLDRRQVFWFPPCLQCQKCPLLLLPGGCCSLSMTAALAPFACFFVALRRLIDALAFAVVFTCSCVPDQSPCHVAMAYRRPGLTQQPERWALEAYSSTGSDTAKYVAGLTGPTALSGLWVTLQEPARLPADGVFTALLLLDVVQFHCRQCTQGCHPPQG
jgi:hypothetical protein